MATSIVPISSGDDDTSVGDGTPQPPSDRLLGFVFNPTDPDIIQLLQCKINNVPVVGDMVKEADLYKASPNNLVKGLHEYVVDGNPHYLLFTQTKVMQQHSYKLEGISKRIRNVGEDLQGYWKPRGERSFITDQFRNVVGSKVHFTYHDGHPRKKVKRIQGSVWNMIEYQIVSKTRNADHLKYAICKLYMDSPSLAFQEREAARSLAEKLRNEILTLEHRGGEWDHAETKDMMRAEINNITKNFGTSFEYEQ